MSAHAGCFNNKLGEDLKMRSSILISTAQVGRMLMLTRDHLQRGELEYEVEHRLKLLSEFFKFQYKRSGGSKSQLRNELRLVCPLSLDRSLTVSADHTKTPPGFLHRDLAFDTELGIMFKLESPSSFPTAKARSLARRLFMLPALLTFSTSATSTSLKKFASFYLGSSSKKIIIFGNTSQVYFCLPVSTFGNRGPFKNFRILAYQN